MDKNPEGKKIFTPPDIRINIKKKKENNDLTYDKNRNTQKESNCIGYSCICFGFLLALAIIAGAIAYIVFGIMYLVQDYKIANECSGSSLWAYVLTAIILAFSRSGARKSSNDEGEINISLLFCLGLIETGLAIWGGVELWQKSCDDLRNSNLWKFGLATFCIQTFCAFIFVFVMPCCLICLARRSS